MTSRASITYRSIPDQSPDIRIFEAGTGMHHCAVHFPIQSQRFRLNCCPWSADVNAEATAANVAKHRPSTLMPCTTNASTRNSSQEFQEQTRAIEPPVLEERAMSQHFIVALFYFSFSFVRQRMLFNCSAVDIQYPQFAKRSTWSAWWGQRRY